MEKWKMKKKTPKTLQPKFYELHYLGELEVIGKRNVSAA